MFRNLIPQLADDFNVLAPDLPGFGISDARIIRRSSTPSTRWVLVELLGLQKFAIYVFDYGAPTGFRIALRFPERISALISQNGNAYLEGLRAQQGLGSDPSLLEKSNQEEP